MVVNEEADAGPPGVAPEPTGVSPPMSVLVLRFAARGDDPARAWFADAVTEGLTTDLARGLPLGSAVAGRQATPRVVRRAPHTNVRSWSKLTSADATSLAVFVS